MTTTRTYLVNGMTCGHCVASVTDEIRSLPGVSEVDVDLVAGGDSRVVVDSVQPLPEDDVRAAVDEAGYRLVGVTT